MDKEDERRRKFFPTVSLGHVLTILSIVGGAVGIYTQVIADVDKGKLEIANLKQDASRKESADRESRQEIRQEIRDVKSDVKDLNVKMDRILFEVTRIPKPPAERF